MGESKLNILNNAEEKIALFNRIGVHYEAVYHYIVRRRAETGGIRNDDYWNDLVDDITAGLISFDMQRMMGKDKYLAEGNDSWAAKLSSALHSLKTKLLSLYPCSLQTVDFGNADIEAAIVTAFDVLSKPGTGLNRRNTTHFFSVGASKILHFIIPDLFIIVDSNARRVLEKEHSVHLNTPDGSSYLEAMGWYQQELNAWATLNCDPECKELVKLDKSWEKFKGARPTPLPRILDKCTFVDKYFIQ